MPNPTTPILEIYEMVQAQANAYLIFNEAIRALEVQLGRGFTTVETDATAEHTVVLADRGKWLRMTSASPNDVTIPDDATLGIVAGDPFTLHVRAAGTGGTSIVAESGVTINAKSLDLLEENDTVTLIHVGADEWDLVGLAAEVSS